MSANTHPTTSDTPKITTSLPGKGRYDEEARRERLEFLSDRGFPPLDLISRTDFEPERLRNNLENFVGAVDVPIGLAGPLRPMAHLLNGDDPATTTVTIASNRYCQGSTSSSDQETGTKPIF